MACTKRNKRKKYKNNPFQVNNWDYDEMSNQFICPEGRKLNFKYNGIRNDKYGFTRHISYYECEDCSNCPVRSLCTKAQEGFNRRIQKIGLGNPIKQWSKIIARKRNPKDLWS